MACGLAQKSRINFSQLWLLAALVLLAAGLAPLTPSVRANGLTIPPEASRILDKIYSGQTDAAIQMSRALQQARPDEPLGYALEGEALWWKRYCLAYEIKYGIADSWKHSKEPEDEAYLQLADQVTRVAESQLAHSESADAHFYAGLGWVLKARVYALRGENRNVAHAAVNGRREMLSALNLDPHMADATAVLGLYNYYVDTLSPIVKLLRVFMGIPAGDKQLGLQQMKTGMDQAALMATDIRFIAARALRQYDQKYEEAISFAEPLLTRYPQNDLFLILLGNLNVEMGRKQKAESYFRDLLDSSKQGVNCGSCAPCPSCDSCRTRTTNIANSFLASLH